jgi:hypothetical protein
MKQFNLAVNYVSYSFEVLYTSRKKKWILKNWNCVVFSWKSCYISFKVCCSRLITFTDASDWSVLVCDRIKIRCLERNAHCSAALFCFQDIVSFRLSNDCCVSTSSISVTMCVCIASSSGRKNKLLRVLEIIVAERCHDSDEPTTSRMTHNEP